ncbi:hypothetical protein RERY_38400 [Rhodococcus erythropolis]|nr:hypothetical protein RERY_38400 [Rhodococcus erythropolis]
MIEACAYSGGDVEVGGYAGEEPFGDVAEFGVGLLGVPDEDVEGAVGGDAVDEHEHPFGLFDRTAGEGEVATTSSTASETVLSTVSVMSM